MPKKITFPKNDGAAMRAPGRYQMSAKESDRNFRQGTAVKSQNLTTAGPMRGGIRL